MAYELHAWCVQQLLPHGCLARHSAPFHEVVRSLARVAISSSALPSTCFLLQSPRIRLEEPPASCRSLSLWPMMSCRDSMMGPGATLPPPRQPPYLSSGPSLQLPPVFSDLTIALDSDSGDGSAAGISGPVRYLCRFRFQGQRWGASPFPGRLRLTWTLLKVHTGSSSPKPARSSRPRLIHSRLTASCKASTRLRPLLFI
jgi:hypothetical protein